MDRTKIQWTDASWNPIRGCTRISAGCVNCYAEKVAARFSGPGLPYEGTIEKGRWNGKIRWVHEAFDQPMRWRRPRKIFVNSMSDLFHEQMTDDEIFKVFDMMSMAVQLRGHTFQVLTKRAERMQIFSQRMFEYLDRAKAKNGMAFNWPVPNVWLGVSVEDQKAADERIPFLLKTVDAVKWISAEPLLGPLDLKVAPIGQWPDGSRWMPNKDEYDDWKYWMHRDNGIQWVVVGGESGAGARPSYIGWIESVVKQCEAAGVPVFVKQMGSNVYAASFREDVVAAFPEDRLRLKDKKGGDMEEWPKHLQVREWPRACSVAA